MKNVKENKRRWKQLVAIFIVAVMLFTTPHIVGFASMGKEEATTAAADGNPDNSDVKVQSEDADSEERYTNGKSGCFGTVRIFGGEDDREKDRDNRSREKNWSGRK